MEKKLKIGMISIGQSPRPDILAIFRQAWGNKIDMIEIGALDGLDHEDAEQMAPQESDDVLVVKMADGQQHIVGRRHLIPRIESCAATLIERHVTALVLLCTGDFRPFRYSVPFIIPQKIVDNIISALVSSGQVVGVMIPADEQQKQMRRNLMSHGIVPVFASASPHLGEDGIVEAAHQLKRYEADFIVMHCFGYTQKMRDIVKDVTGKPVLLSNLLVAKVAGELLL
jgi:protein AroM